MINKDTMINTINEIKSQEVEFNEKIANAILKVFANSDSLTNRTKHKLVRKGILTFLNFSFYIDMDKTYERICLEYVSDYIKAKLEEDIKTKVYPTLYIQKPIVYKDSYKLDISINIEIPIGRLVD